MGMAGKARWVDHVIIEHWFRSLKQKRLIATAMRIHKS